MPDELVAAEFRAEDHPDPLDIEVLERGLPPSRAKRATATTAIAATITARKVCLSLARFAVEASITSRIAFFLPLACDRGPLAVSVADTFISLSPSLGPSQVTIR